MRMSSGRVKVWGMFKKGYIYGDDVTMTLR